MKAHTDLRTIKTIMRAALGVTAAAGLLALTGVVRADDSLTMAPPVAGAYGQDTSDVPANASADTVFKWTETPEGEEVPITRAAFDQGGYQLYDTQGETIVIPFTNQNLYVMKFGRSTTGHMYFINEGAVPVLYVPQDGFLENATVPGARWYPFSKDFHPDHPVFEGIAPSYSAFLNLGWFPDTHCYGGFYSNTAFVTGGVFLPTVGLFFEVGGHPYYGWDGYHDYYRFHPAPYRITYYQRDVYHYADRPVSDFHRFDGGFGGDRPYYAHRSFAGGGGFGGGGHYSTRTFQGGGDHNFGGGHDGGFGGGGHTFTNNSGGDFRGAGPRPGISRGGDQTFSNHTFGGASQNSGGDRTFTDGGHDFGGHTFIGGGGGGGFQGSGHTFTNAGSDNARSNGPRAGVSQGGGQTPSDHNFGGGNQNSGGGGGRGSDQAYARGGGGFGGGNGGNFGGGGGFGGGAHVRGGR